MSQKYFEYSKDAGDFIPIAFAGVGASVGMRAVFQRGEVDAGSFKITFGRNPVNSQSHSNTDFREVYWRQYLKMQDGWTGNPGKLSRATILAAPNWSQAMIAHIWGGTSDYLVMDPASGINAAVANLNWLGSRRGVTPIFSIAQSGTWYCVETHVKLNTPGSSDGVLAVQIEP